MFIRSQSANVSCLTVTVALALWSIHGSPCVAEPQDVHRSSAVSQRLDAITPSFPAPPVTILAGRDDAPAPIELVGVDLAQDGKAIAASGPVLLGLSPVNVTAYWLPTAPLQRTLDIELRLTSANPLITRSQRATAGPVDKPAWGAGSVYKQQYAVDVERLAQAFSGKAFLVIGVNPRGGAKPQYLPLQSIPVSVTPRVGKSPVAADAVQTAFGGRLRNLDVDFALGKDARQKLVVDASARRQLRAIGVVSAFGYGGLAQGVPVCDVVFTDEGGHTATAAIVCGVDTARADYDSYPEKANHAKVKIVESSDTADFNAEGRPFHRHRYAATLAVPKELGAVVSVEFCALTDRIFEVYDVALLYGEKSE